jgi:hypothetical protein
MGTDVRCRKITGCPDSTSTSRNGRDNKPEPSDLLNCVPEAVTEIEMAQLITNQKRTIE